MQSIADIEAKVADTGQIQLEWCLRALSITSSIPPVYFNVNHFVNILTR